MDRESEHGWKLIGPRKKYWHFFRSGTSLCANWAIYNTAPPYILLPPSEGLICKRCLELFNSGPRLVDASKERADDASAGGRFHPGRKMKVGAVVDVTEIVEDGCWGQEQPGHELIGGKNPLL